MRLSSRRRAGVRRVSWILLAFIACAAFAASCTTLLVSGSLSTTMASNRAIEASFAHAAEYVEAFRAREGHWPAADTFSAWTTSQTGHRLSGMELETDHVPDEAISELGRPPQDSYLLMLWRGEWMEYRAGWSGKTTVPDERADYFVTGSAFLDVTVFVLLGFAAALGAKWTRARAPLVTRS